MKLFDFIPDTAPVILEDVNQKLKADARLKKMVGIHFRHDTTVPPKIKFRMGPKPTDDQIMDAWIAFIDGLNNSEVYGIISPQKQYHEWVTKVYATGATDWEDIKAQYVEAVMGLVMLSRRNLIPADKRDINKYNSMQELTRYVQKFAAQLRDAKAEEQVKKITADAKHVTIVDNEDYAVIVPLNMGAAIKFGRSIPPITTWCTATTTVGGNYWPSYASRSYIFIFFDKKDKNVKYQCAPGSSQFMNPSNNYIDVPAFAQSYPCAMEDIVKGFEQHAAEIQASDFPGYREYHAQGGNAEHTIGLMRRNYPQAFGDCKSEEELDDEMYNGLERQGDADANAGPEENDEAERNR